MTDMQPWGISDPVLLVGAFGQRNPGDEALLTAFQRALGDTPLFATSQAPDQTTHRHGVVGVDVGSPRALARAVANSRAVVFAGGSVVKVLPPETGRHRLSLLGRAVALASLAHSTGRGPYLVGVGVGSLPDSRSRTLARALASRAEMLILRDAESAAALTAIGVPPPLRVGADPVWTLLDAAPPLRADGNRVVVVPSHWTTPPEHLPALAAALQSVCDRGLSVAIQPWQIGGPGLDDADLTHDLVDSLRGDVTVLPAPRDLLDAAAVFRDARLVVAARFHAVVAAAAAGVPLVAVRGPEPKQSALAERLGQPAVPIHAGPAALRAAIDQGLAGAPAPASAVRAEIAAAEEGFSLLRLVLRPEDPPVEQIDGLRLEPREHIAS